MNGLPCPRLWVCFDIRNLDGFQAWQASTNNAIPFEPADAESGALEMPAIKAKQSLGAVPECGSIDLRASKTLTKLAKARSRLAA